MAEYVLTSLVQYGIVLHLPLVSKAHSWNGHTRLPSWFTRPPCARCAPKWGQNACRIPTCPSMFRNAAISLPSSCRGLTSPLFNSSDRMTKYHVFLFWPAPGIPCESRGGGSRRVRTAQNARVRRREILDSARVVKVLAVVLDQLFGLFAHASMRHTVRDVLEHAEEDYQGRRGVYRRRPQVARRDALHGGAEHGHVAEQCGDHGRRTAFARCRFRVEDWRAIDSSRLTLTVVDHWWWWWWWWWWWLLLLCRSGMTP